MGNTTGRGPHKALRTGDPLKLRRVIKLGFIFDGRAGQDGDRAGKAEAGEVGRTRQHKMECREAVETHRPETGATAGIGDTDTSY